MKRHYSLNALLFLGILSFCFYANAQTGGGQFGVGPDMNRTRIAPFPAVLSNGNVAIFGGREFDFVSCSYADFYNPGTNSFTEVVMNFPHDASNVVKLSDGTYLIIGGSENLGVAPGYSSCEIYNPSTNTFTPTTSMTMARMMMGAAQLNNGNVLIAGAWYNPTGAQVAEVYDLVNNTFTQTGSLNEPRAYPNVLPTTDGGAVVFGGWPTYSGTTYTSVEYYEPVNGTFQTLSSQIIPADSGWLMGTYLHPHADIRLANGNYLLMAYRYMPNMEYALITFNPDTKVFAKVNTSVPLIDSYTDGGFYDYTVDKNTNTAYLLGVDSASNPTSVALISVNLTTGVVYHPGSVFTLPVSEYLFPGITYMPNGKILVAGVSSTPSDYFHATAKTYIITPSAVGIENTAPLYESMTCYPNPATDNITLSAPSLPEGQYEILITDLSGRELQLFKEKVAGNSPVSWTFSTERLHSGMYFLTVKGENGFFATRVFVSK